MTQILPFNPADPDVQAKVAKVLEAAPVKNLTPDEVLDTLRLIELEEFLAIGRYRDVVIHRNDQRLALCDDKDKFLAMLIDCDKRDVLLFTGRCMSLFGGKIYHWRKIGHKCPITSVASAVSEFGSGYYGRGWEIAPHIQRLREWIVLHNINKGNRKRTS